MEVSIVQGEVLGAFPEQWSSAYCGKESTAKRFEVRWLRTLKANMITLA